VAAMNAVLGAPGTILMAVAILISTFGCNNGLILAGARVYYAMARDALFFRRAGDTNRFHAPAAALYAQGIWAAFLTLPRTVVTNPANGPATYGNVYTQLLEYIIAADLVFYVLMVAAVMVLRRKAATAERPYRTWGYPVVPLIYITIGVLLIVDLAWLAPSTAGVGFVIVISGLPVYLLWKRRNAAVTARSVYS
nr:APC family permease [Chthoniobacterales bacterium]